MSESGFPQHGMRDLLDPKTRQTIDDFDAVNGGFLSQEHKPDGTHAAVTADSLSVNAEDLAAPTWITLQIVGADGVVHEVGRISAVTIPKQTFSSSPYQLQIRGGQDISLITTGYLGLGSANIPRVQANFGALPNGNADAYTEQQIYEALNVMHRLGFVGIGSYTVSAGDTDVANDDSTMFTPKYTAYHLDMTADRSMCGIKADATLGARGHLFIGVNISSHNLTLQHDTTASSWKRLLMPEAVDVALKPNGGFVAWYDTTTLKWRVMLCWNRV